VAIRSPGKGGSARHPPARLITSGGRVSVSRSRIGQPTSSETRARVESWCAPRRIGRFPGSPGATDGAPGGGDYPRSHPRSPELMEVNSRVWDPATVLAARRIFRRSIASPFRTLGQWPRPTPGLAGGGRNEHKWQLSTWKPDGFVSTSTSAARERWLRVPEGGPSTQRAPLRRSGRIAPADRGTRWVWQGHLRRPRCAAPAAGSRRGGNAHRCCLRPRRHRQD